MSSGGEYVKYNTPTRFKTAPLRDPYKKVVSRALTKRAGKAQNRQSGNNQNISSMRSKLKKEQARKKDLEHKLQIALAQKHRKHRVINAKVQDKRKRERIFYEKNASASKGYGG